jgi:sn-glycerol 3-phosphate transport system substrate-binding protein
MTRRWVVSVAVAVAFLAAACTPGDDAGPPAPGTGTAPGGSVLPASLPPCPIGALAHATQPVHVEVWYQLSGKVESTFLSLIQQYNASQTKVVVKADPQGASYPELMKAYAAGIPSKQLPDIAMMEDTTAKFMADSGTVLPAQSCFDAANISTDQFVKTVVSHYTIDGVLWPATAGISDVLTYYNKNQFLKAGLDPNRAPQTLDEVRTFAEQIKAKNPSEKPVVMKMAPWFVETMLTGDRKPIVNNDNGAGSGVTDKALFGTDETTGILTWVRDMVRDNLLDAVPDTDGQIDHYLAIATQKSAMTIESSSSATSIEAFLTGDRSVVSSTVDTATIDTSKLDIGVGPVYGLHEPGKGQVGGNASYIMSTSPPEHQAAAWDFLNWFNQRPQQVRWHIEGSVLPFLDAAAEDPQVQAFWANDRAGQWLKVADDELRHGIDPSFTGPVIGPYDQFRDAMRSALDSVTTGGDPKAAVDGAVQKTDDALAQYGAHGGG